MKTLNYLESFLKKDLEKNKTDQNESPLKGIRTRTWITILGIIGISAGYFGYQKEKKPDNQAVHIASAEPLSSAKIIPAVVDNGPGLLQKETADAGKKAVEEKAPVADGGVEDHAVPENKKPEIVPLLLAYPAYDKGPNVILNCTDFLDQKFTRPTWKDDRKVYDYLFDNCINLLRKK